MIYEVLYCISDSFGYPKITAMKPVGWKWGKGELDENVFKIVIMEISDDEKIAIQNTNDFCLNVDLEAVKSGTITKQQIQASVALTDSPDEEKSLKVAIGEVVDIARLIKKPIITTPPIKVK